jgi:hypothetical protein
MDAAMRTRLFHTIVSVSAAFTASASWGCSDGGDPSLRKDEPLPDGALASDAGPVSHASAADAGPRSAEADGGDAATAPADLDAAIDVDAGWPPTK